VTIFRATNHLKRSSKNKKRIAQEWSLTKTALEAAGHCFNLTNIFAQHRHRARNIVRVVRIRESRDTTPLKASSGRMRYADGLWQLTRACMDQPEILYTTLHQHTLYLEQDVLATYFRSFDCGSVIKEKVVRNVILAFSHAANSVITGFFSFIARNVIFRSDCSVLYVLRFHFSVFH
jgi:hypothetical protein